MARLLSKHDRPLDSLADQIASEIRTAANRYAALVGSELAADELAVHARWLRKAKVPALNLQEFGLLKNIHHHKKSPRGRPHHLSEEKEKLMDKIIIKLRNELGSELAVAKYYLSALVNAGKAQPEQLPMARSRVRRAIQRVKKVGGAES